MYYQDRKSPSSIKAGRSSLRETALQELGGSTAAAQEQALKTRFEVENWFLTRCKDLDIPKTLEAQPFSFLNGDEDSQ